MDMSGAIESTAELRDSHVFIVAIWHYVEPG
jgi:hypothetical protein